MALKDRLQVLKTPEEVDAFVSTHPLCAIYKAGSCHKTPETFRHVEEQLGPRDDVPVGLIRVIENRPASNRVADMTGIRHESPQLVLFQSGKAVFDRDNWDITSESVAEGLALLPAPAAP